MAVVATVMTLAGGAMAQNLHYKVIYDLGFIHEVAGHADMTLSGEGNNVTGYLSGSSIHWGGRVYCVNDTLVAQLDKSGAGTMPGMKVNYRSGWYTKPTVSDLEAGTYDRSNPINYKTISGAGQLDASNATMEAVTITADMIGLFRVFQMVDFNTLTPGKKYTLPMTLSDGSSQLVYCTYLGESSSDINGVQTPTYDVRFEYTYNGAPSNYPVKALIARDTKIPVRLSADLAIGKMEMVYSEE